MQSPPPFEQGYNSGPKKRSPWVIVLIVFAVLGLCCVLPIGLLGGAGYFLAKQGMAVGECFVNAGILSKSLKEYQAKNGGKLPNAAKWQTELAPFVAKNIPKKAEAGPFNFITAEGDWTCTTDGARTGFMFNASLSGKKAADIKSPESTPVIFETNAVQKNQSGPYKAMPYATSPKIFNQNRGWIVITPTQMGVVDKTGQIVETSGDSFDFKTSSEAGVKVTPTK